MDAGAFSDARVVKAVAPFVRVMLRAVKGYDGIKEPMARFGINGVPAVLILDPSGKKIGPLEYWPSEKALHRLRAVARRWPGDSLLRKIVLRSGDPWAWIRTRIARLACDKIEERDRATRELRDLQKALDGALRWASASGDPETRGRVRTLLRGSDR